MCKYKYIRKAGVKELVNEHGKHCSAEFLEALERVVAHKVSLACRQFNGHKKRVTGSQLSFK